MSNCKVISILNQKGGVLKSTTVLHLGSALASLGKKVLLIDLDVSQASLTVSIMGHLEEGSRGVLHALFKDCTLNQVTYKTSQENLFIVPSEINYKGRTIPLDVALTGQAGSDQILKKLIKPLTDVYDFILIDNGPTLGIATINSLVASDYFMVPTLADYLSLVAVAKTMETIEQVKDALDHNIENLGLLLTMVDGRESISKDSKNELQKHFEGKVFNTCIQRNVRFKELAQSQKTIFDVTKSSDKGNKNYRDLAIEVLNRLSIEVPTKIALNNLKKINHSVGVQQ